MIITARHLDPEPRWSDPLIGIQLEDFVAVRSRMQQNVEAGSGNELVLLSMNLCDMSRQIVFRLFRISEDEVEALVAEFEEAARVVREAARLVTPESQKMTIDYADHIQARARRLGGFLQQAG